MLEVRGRFSNGAARILGRIGLDSGKVDRMERILRLSGAELPRFQVTESIIAEMVPFGDGGWGEPSTITATRQILFYDEQRLRRFVRHVPTPWGHYCAAFRIVVVWICWL